MKARNVKWQIMAMSAAFILAAVQPSFAGTGVGNGGMGDREQYVENLRRDMGQPVTDHDATVPELSEWCARASGLLRRELSRAQNMVQRNNFDSAWATLQDALYVVAQSINVDPEQGGPMTKTLADRGLLISAAMDEAMPNGNKQVLVSKLNFIFDYVQFVIDMESYIDSPWYVPYRYQYGSCGQYCPPSFRFAEFQQLYLDYARQQLEFVARDLTMVVRANGGLEARPIGDPRVFLKAAELTTGFIANDVAQNLFAYSHSCTVGDLRYLAETLRSFNMLGDRTVFPDFHVAVAATFNEMMQSVDRLKSDPGSCR